MGMEGKGEWVREGKKGEKRGEKEKKNLIKFSTFLLERWNFN